MPELVYSPTVLFPFKIVLYMPLDELEKYTRFELFFLPLFIN